MTEVRLTHIGGPTVLLEILGWRLLTDPTFDPPSRSYSFCWDTGSTKVAGPAIPAEDLDRPDAILLTHDHHAALPSFQPYVRMQREEAREDPLWVTGVERITPPTKALAVVPDGKGPYSQEWSLTSALHHARIVKRVRPAALPFGLVPNEAVVRG